MGFVCLLYVNFVEMGNLFSLAQWQELELQALIYRYMLAGASVPQELLLPIKKSLFHQSHLNFLHYPLQHNFPHHQPCESLSLPCLYV